MKQMVASPVPTEERTRETFFSLVGRHLPELYRALRRQINVYETAGYLLPAQLTAEEVVDKTLLRAYRDFVRAPARGDGRRWLIRLGEHQLEASARRLKAERASSTVVESPPAAGVEILYFHRPEQDLRVQDILPELAVAGDDQGGDRELHRCLQVALARLPRQWRRALREPDVAAEHDLEHARAYVRQILLEAGCLREPLESRKLP